MELVGQNAQKIARIHDFFKFCSSVSWPRMWLVGLINTTRYELQKEGSTKVMQPYLWQVIRMITLQLVT